MEKEDLKFIYDTIIHQTDKTDIKANFLLILQAAIIGYFLTRIKELEFSDFYIIALSVITAILIITTLTFIVIAMWPRLSSKASHKDDSIIFFHSIINSYKKDRGKLLEKFEKCGTDDFINDLLNQVINISHVVVKKYLSIRRAIICLIVEICFFITLFILSFIY